MAKDNNSLFNWFIVIAMICVIGLLAFNLTGLSNEASTQKGLSVSGSGKIDIKADKAEIYVSVVTLNKSAQIAGDLNSQIAKNVTSALENIGINASNIETQSYTITQQYQYNSKTLKNDLIGYQATHQFKITTTNVNELGRIIDTSTNAGANEINNLVFDLTNATKKQANKQALDIATQNAMQKAQDIATGLNVNLGEISSVSEANYIYTPYGYNGASLLKEAGVSSTPIIPGKVEVSVNVNVNYNLK